MKIVGRFHYDKSGYPRWNDSGELVHRTVNRTPNGLVTHHKDGDKGNFRRENLRAMTPSAHGCYHAKQKRSFW